jgi:tRNA (cytidine/uridine-2'-O-)-methyltransferase
MEGLSRDTGGQAGTTRPEAPPEPLLHVVLVEPEIHTNTGNIGRLCVAAGAVLHLVEPLGFEITDARLKRAGLDYWQHLVWRRHPSLAAFEATPAGSGRTWYASGRGARIYTDVSYRIGDVLVFGKESVGLPAALLEERRRRTIRIPIHPLARSLNLAHAVGIVVFEALRQLRAAGGPRVARAPSLD